MSRVKNSVATRNRRKKILKAAKGYYGRKSKLYKTAKEAVMRGLQYAYRDRRVKKREFRKLWITRISAACKMRDVSYSKFMNGLKKSNVILNRKMLSNIAILMPDVFDKLVEEVKHA